MNLGLIQDSARREFEGADRPAQIGLPNPGAGAEVLRE